MNLKRVGCHKGKNLGRMLLYIKELMDNLDIKGVKNHISGANE